MIICWCSFYMMSSLILSLILTSTIQKKYTFILYVTINNYLFNCRQSNYRIVQNFDVGKFWHFWCFPVGWSKFNPSNCLKTIQHLQVYGERQWPSVKIFSIKIFPVKYLKSQYPSKFLPSKFCAIWYIYMHGNNLYSHWSYFVLNQHILMAQWWLSTIQSVFYYEFTKTRLVDAYCFIKSFEGSATSYKFFILYLSLSTDCSFLLSHIYKYPVHCTCPSWAT